jgi:formylglycine-generating enzyme required for sulfatase activity
MIRYRCSFLILAILIFVALPGFSQAATNKSAPAATPATKPISSEGLLKALKIGGLPSSELVQIIGERGVDFEVNAAIEEQLKDAGATPEVIKAVRANYRPPAPPPKPPAPAPSPAPTPTPAPTPADDVLTNQTVIEMVAAKVPENLILAKIRTSKTQFDLSAAGLIELSRKGVPPQVVEAMVPPSEPAKQRVDDRATPNLRWRFVAIPAGEFDMGCSPGDGDCDNDEKPRHRVRISKGFEIGKYEVTQAMWESVMGSNPSDFKGPDLPVEQVSWDDVQQFLRGLNARNDGYRYRLPTEAEWEYAARAGSTSASYGNVDAIAWCDDNSVNRTHPGGQKQPNAWGLYDMEGNVWEWVQDWYDENYYRQSSSVNPQGSSSGQYRVVRGGSWKVKARSVRSSNRNWDVPGARNDYTGFRCVREVAP